jgi:hypothetical protein
VDELYRFFATVARLANPDAYLLRGPIDVGHHGYLIAFLRGVIGILFGLVNANGINPESYLHLTLSKVFQCIQKVGLHL